MAACWSRSPRWRWPAISARRSARLRNLAPAHAFWFGEDQARYVATVAMGDADQFLDAAKKAGVPVTVLGETGSDALTLVDSGTISVADLRAAHEASSRT